MHYPPELFTHSPNTQTSGGTGAHGGEGHVTAVVGPPGPSERERDGNEADAMHVGRTRMEGGSGPSG